jgi:hypothetical protein
VVERDGVRVAVAVQVHVDRGGCGHDHHDPESRHEPGGSVLLDVLGVALAAVGFLLASCANLVRLAAIGLTLGVGRAGFLALNVAGLLLANMARGYLYAWAQMGGTHKRLSRNLSPWLPEAETPGELAALVAEVLERPKSVPPYVPPLPPHTRTTWAQLAAAPEQQPATAKRLKP